MKRKIKNKKGRIGVNVPCGKWFHRVQRSNQLCCRELWGLHCCRSVLGVWSSHTSSDPRRSSPLWLFFSSLSSCCSLSPSTWVASSPTSSISSLKRVLLKPPKEHNFGPDSTQQRWIAFWVDHKLKRVCVRRWCYKKSVEKMVGSGKVSTFGGFGRWLCGRRVVGDRRRSG